MDCDIHLVLEIRRRKPKKVIVSPEVRNDSGENIIHKEFSYTLDTDWRRSYLTGYDNTWGDRVYGMFARLADVRNYWNYDHLPIRGLPEDVTDSTLMLATYKIGDEEDVDTVTQETASKWIKNNYCKIVKVFGKDRVTSPDYHSANWCTTEEMESCINKCFKRVSDYTGDYVEWLALLGAMKGYEQTGEWECRAVFWFDN